MTDILFNDGDVRIENGDFVVADSTDQETELIMYANKGQLPLNFLLGVNLQGLINGAYNKMAVTATIRKNMKNDDLDIESLNIVGSNIDIVTKRRK